MLVVASFVASRACLATSMIDTPWAFCDLCGLLRVPVGHAVGEQQDVVGVLVVLHEQAARSSPLIGKYTMPSLCMPHCCAWSAAVLLASCWNAGPSDTGSPQAISTFAV